MDNKRLIELYGLYHKGIASPSQIEELMVLIQDLPDEQLSELLLKTWNSQNTEETFFTSDTKAKLLSRLKPSEKYESEVHSIGAERRTLMVRIVAAAAVVLVLSASVFLLLQKKSNDLAERTQKVKVVHDIAPGGDKALLTLADGRQIVLDTATNGTLAQQGGIKVIKIGGQLSYDHEGNPAQVLYNTITTPRGGQYQLELADGSKVWLNAASSLRFPTAFTGKDRTVELTGEGYFEVTHDASKPFHVKVNDMDVQVLGTHFNINSYSDEPSIKTTLLEGRVQVKKDENYVYLNPGQQAIVQPTGNDINVADDVDVEEVVAWKNGRFLFNNAQIETIMRQVARWYDVDVVYEKKINETFSGPLPRSQNVSELLKMLEATGSVHFEISGKQIIVKP